MSYLEAIFLGSVQGITEFLPVSSTAHIILMELILGQNFSGLGFEVFLHLASVLAVIIYYFNDLLEIVKGFFGFLIKNKSKKNRVHFYFGLYLLLATLITGVLGLILEDLVSGVMKTTFFMGLALLVTGVFLVLIERFQNYGSRTEKEMSWRDSVIVGLGQTLAVLPGISRSGATLITGLWAGLKRKTAVRYSFLLLIPVALGSSLLSYKDLTGEFIAEIGWGPLIGAFAASFLFSLLGIIWLIDILQKKRLVYLAIYCFLLGTSLLFV
ncbi:MAG: undecaprenyl-diphosphatase UppP [Halanaerobiaceae bacterium]